MFRLGSYLPRIGRWPRLLLAGCCLLLALASAVHDQPNPASGVRTAPVVVAAKPLPAGRVLLPSDLAAVHWPSELRPPAARADPAALRGRRLAGPVGRGEVITDSRLVGADLAAGLPARLVAAAVRLGDPHAVDLVQAGDRIDLLATARAADPFAAPPVRPSPVRTVTRNCLVLAVLPATDVADAELVLAVERTTAVRLTRDAATQVFTAVVAPP